MSEQANVKESLISSFEQLKSQYGTIVTMMCEVAALRTALLENSPEAQKRYSEVFAQEMAKETPAIVAAMKLYDDLILALKSGSGWVN